MKKPDYREIPREWKYFCIDDLDLVDDDIMPVSLLTEIAERQYAFLCNGLLEISHKVPCNATQIHHVRTSFIIGIRLPHLMKRSELLAFFAEWQASDTEKTSPQSSDASTSS